jgi:hypothetical protein
MATVCATWRRGAYSVLCAHFLGIITNKEAEKPLFNFHLSSSSSTFRFRPFSLFAIRINLDLWILQTVGMFPWASDQLCSKAAAYIGQHKHRMNAHRHPCLELDSNTRSQYLSGRRHYMPYSARQLWSAEEICIVKKMFTPLMRFQIYAIYARASCMSTDSPSELYTPINRISSSVYVV